MTIGNEEPINRRIVYQIPKFLHWTNNIQPQFLNGTLATGKFIYKQSFGVFLSQYSRKTPDKAKQQ